MRSGRCALVSAAKAAVVLLRDAAIRWSEDGCPRRGASLAYAALFSLFPLILLSLTTVGFVLGDSDEARHTLVSSLVGSYSPESQRLVEQTLESLQAHHTARGVGAAVGVLALVAGASGVFSELQASLVFIWRVDKTRTRGFWRSVVGLLWDRMTSFAIVVGASLVLLATLMVHTAIGVVAQTQYAVGPLWSVTGEITAFACSAGMLAAIYRVVPQCHVAWSDVLGASLITSLVLAGLRGLLAWYLIHVSRTELGPGGPTTATLKFQQSAGRSLRRWRTCQCAYLPCGEVAVAARSMMDATTSGLETKIAWLPSASATVAPARLAIDLWRGGGIILSAVDTR